MLLEAPNWTLDGRALILNAAGRLWRFDLRESSLSEVPLTGIPELNNDHVLDPDGGHIFLSGEDGHIYRAPLAGGPATRITDDDGSWHFLHGVSPDGRHLAYMDIAAGDFSKPGRLRTIPAAGGAPTTWRSAQDTATGPSTRPTGTGCTSTPSPSAPFPGMPSLPGSVRTAAGSSGC